MPCVSHGQCCAMAVVGAGPAGGITGAFGGSAPFGKSVAAADGTTFGAAAANKIGFNFV